MVVPGPRIRAAVLAALLAVVAVAGAWAEPRAFALTLRDSRLPGSHRLSRVQPGEDGSLPSTTDQHMTLQLHGYYIDEKATPKTPVSMRVTARAKGRYPIEIHGAGGTERIVGYLEVHPR